MCNGCIYANLLRETEARLPPSCPFCRTPEPTSDEEGSQLAMKRAAANDPIVVCNVGMGHFRVGNFAAAIDVFKMAAELGHMPSHHHLACLYHEGGNGIEMDMRKAKYHMELAAIGGHPIARHNLAFLEEGGGNMERATKHLIIAANLGYDPSMKALKEFYERGVVNKEDFTATLLAYQAAVDATKSPLREAAESARRMVQRGV